mgnify:CR=1 FL=1
MVHTDTRAGTETRPYMTAAPGMIRSNLEVPVNWRARHPRTKQRAEALASEWKGRPRANVSHPAAPFSAVR